MTFACPADGTDQANLPTNTASPRMALTCQVDIFEWTWILRGSPEIHSGVKCSQRATAASKLHTTRHSLPTLLYTHRLAALNAPGTSAGEFCLGCPG